MSGLIKICGLTIAADLEAALVAGADLVGFVRFPRSPRHVDLERGRELSVRARGRAARVLLLVDPDDRDVDEAVTAIDPDLVQLHGRETPERTAALRRRVGRPVMKALSIGAASDLDRLPGYAEAADRVLLDAKPPAGSTRPGGNGRTFDWTLLAGLVLDRGPPIMLSGGLDPDNVARAIATSGVTAVDVSSGVECRPGVKDGARIGAFVEAARAGFAAQHIQRTLA